LILSIGGIEFHVLISQKLLVFWHITKRC